MYVCTGIRSMMKKIDHLLPFLIINDFFYNLLLEPIWVYGIQLWETTNPSDLNKIQTFQSKCLRCIYEAPFYISNDTFHRNFRVPKVQNVAKILVFYQRLHSNVFNHFIPLISNLSTHTIPRRRLKQKWYRDLLVDKPHALKFHEWMASLP